MIAIMRVGSPPPSMLANSSAYLRGGISVPFLHLGKVGVCQSGVK